MNGQRELVNKIRSVMEPANPVPASTYGDVRYQADVADRIAALRLSENALSERRFSERGFSGNGFSENGFSVDGTSAAGRSRRSGHNGIRGAGAWRVAAPVLSGLAVAAIVVGVTLAGRSAGEPKHPRPAVGTAAALPRYYVTINDNGFLTFKPSTLIVHSTLTGKTIASFKLPKSKGLYGWVTAAKSDREFFIVGDRTPGHFLSAAGLYRLRLAPNGHVTSFTTLSTNLGLGEANNIDGVALSPDGSRLAVAVEITHKFTPKAELVVIPLNHGPARIWIDRQANEFIWQPVWTSNTNVAFLWWDHLKGPEGNFIAGRTQERVLSTAAPGSSLLSARVLATASDKLGFIVSALAAPRGGPIIASAYKNVPASGNHGRATVRLVAISPQTGKVIKVFSSRVVAFHTATGRDDADFRYEVSALDPTGKDALVKLPHFGKLIGGVLTPLSGGAGAVAAAAW
jgi:hypothetical protein